MWCCLYVVMVGYDDGLYWVWVTFCVCVCLWWVKSLPLYVKEGVKQLKPLKNRKYGQ